jgi:dihydroflavonol-4-reductase
VRPTKVYGVGEHEYSYLTLAKLCKKGVLPIVGKGQNYTSNIYITDFVKGLVQLVQYGSFGETYILTSNESIAFMDSGKLIAKIIGKRIAIIPIPATVMVALAAVGEKLFLAINKKPIVTKLNIESTISNRVYDISKAKNELHYNPEVSLNEGITRTVKWYIKEGLV